MVDVPTENKICVVTLVTKVKDVKTLLGFVIAAADELQGFNIMYIYFQFIKA